MDYNLKVIAYIRCSTTEQGTDGWSLETQEQRIAAWALAAGAEIVETISDVGVSGSLPLAGRPEGRRVAEMVDARRPAVDAVVIVRLDRLTRSAAEALAYLQKFAKGKVGLVSLADRLDLTTPQGRAMAQLGAVFAEMERGLIAQRTAEALGALRDARRVYSPVPYGFAAVAAMLVEVEAEQEVLSRIRQQRDRGDSYRRIADALNAESVPARRGGKWFAASVRSVLLTNDLMTKGDHCASA